MNRHEAITLLQLARGAKIVSVRYDGQETTRDYTYKLIGFSAAPGDLVVVPAQGVVKIATVRSVHNTLPSNVPSGTKLKYVIARVDMTLHDQMEAEESALVQKLAAAELQERLSKYKATTGVDLMSLSTPAMDALIAPSPSEDDSTADVAAAKIGRLAAAAAADDKPVIDWSVIDESYCWLARDADGECWIYTAEPYPQENKWIATRASGGVKVPPRKLVHPGTCDWRDSLVQRPT